MSKSGLLSLNEYPKLPLVTYEQGQDTFPEVGYLMCYEGVREDDKKNLRNGVQLWTVDVDVVDIQIRRLLHPNLFPDHWGRMHHFWTDPALYGETSFFDRSIRTPAQTIFCSRVKLLERVA